MNFFRACLGRERGLVRGSFFGVTVSLSFFALLGTYLHWMDAESLPPTAVTSLVGLFIVFSLFLGSDTLFQRDHESGVLEELLVQRASFLTYTVGRGLGGMLVMGLPLACLAPLLLTLYGVAFPFFMMLGLYGWLTLLFFSLTLLGTALTLGASHQKSLLFFFLLPFYIPLFLVSHSLFGALGSGQTLAPYLKLLGGLTLIDIPLSLVLTGQALKHAAREVF